MIKRLVISLFLIFGSWASAGACSFVLPYCDENGRCVSEYYSPRWIDKVNLAEDFDFIAVATAEKKPGTLEQYDDLEPSVSAIIKVERYIKGNTLRTFEQKYLAANGPDTGDEPREPSKRFGLWDHMNLGFPKRFRMSRSSCGAESGKALSFEEPYLIFGHNWQEDNGDTYYNISKAMPLAGFDDSLIEEIASIVEARPNAANRMDAKTYLSHMTGFAELTIQTCPTREQTYYTDSLYVNAKGQHGSAYQINSSYNYAEPTIDVRDISSYREAVNNIYRQLKNLRDKLHKKRAEKGESFDQAYYDAERERLTYKCEPQQKYLAVFRLPNRRDSLRYLPIQNGTVDLKDVLTNIEFDGPTRISLYDAKNWIIEANTP